ncbi:hypothetical protein N7474_000243 [Penicillium riverlandense]|uniref:uncharacterized protein n=1 Tax=Penicillium riverlandense TaxID=1903569 RepID=UPI00254796B5|nr:uncharacterized protein N7474_000243 [Penicillium riverlandense]KAJ5831932.1 hypothetical protein N7474_000243 [Penicillium riverlandense]
MVLNKVLAGAAALSALVPVALALDPSLKTNVAVYYGQGANQPRLSHFCEQTSMDIINLGFVNTFPEAVLDWPGDNFGNQCDGVLFPDSELLSGCHQIWEDIPTCKDMGKTIMLSIGGAYTTNEVILTDEIATWFADFLWYSFGPYQLSETLFPRPFGNVAVDGFDFDIEHNGGAGYATMISRLRELFDTYPDQKFYISGAPQCSIPDAQLGDAIENAAFDFLWVQFYNTPACAAANYVSGSGNFNFDEWVDVIRNSRNPETKLFVGLPASEDAANPGYYITPDEAKTLVEEYMGLYPEHFGGIMLWEATASENNTIDGFTYAQHMKHILGECAPPSPPPVQSVTPPLSSSLAPTSTPSVPAIPSSASPSGPSGSGSKPSVPGHPYSSVPVSRTTTPNKSVPAASSPTPPGVPTTSGSEIPTGGVNPSAPGITSAPSVTPTPSTSEPVTITTVIVTSYTDICPTGFTTVWMTITTTYCPGNGPAPSTATETAGVTQPGSGPTSTTASIPEGWTTTVTVCTQCAPTPTTVTLTLPCTMTATQTQPEIAPTSVPEGYTTTVTFCKHCGPTGSTVTITVPYTLTSAQPTGTSYVSSSSPMVVSYPWTTASRAPAAPTTTPEGTSPVYTGAASRGAVVTSFGTIFAALLSPFML